MLGTTHPFILLIAAGVVGLIVGSFLNVVVYRLPILLQRHWQRECRELLKLPFAPESPRIFNLLMPRSHCPHCNTPLRGWQNIPLCSYLFLRGRCAFCAKQIAKRYLMLEICSAVVSLIVVWHYGMSWQTLAALLFSWSLLALTFIDVEQLLLPDSITLPLLWLGLLVSIPAFFTDSQAAIVGAVAGYIILWLVAWIFQHITNKIGMGAGDFKLFALLGAWLGWQLLPLVLLFASVLGSIVGLIMLGLKKHHRDKPLPFGPYLALAGWIALLWGHDLMHIYLG